MYIMNIWGVLMSAQKEGRLNGGLPSPLMNFFTAI